MRLCDQLHRRTHLFLLKTAVGINSDFDKYYSILIGYIIEIKRMI